MKLIHKANSVGLPEVRSEDTDRDGQDFFRVLSGTYNTLQEAQAQLDSAISMGFKAAIYRW
jgi:septal ring-binding cell division protein DamX